MMHLELERVQTALAAHYDVQRVLGRGGMSLVYAGRDLVSDTPVAIKVLRPEFAATILADRFQREIGILGNLHHPNILRLVAAGTAGHLLYYVMPYADGGTLEERLEREIQLRLDEALHITRLIARAIDYAHGHNVLHRDIKPGNVIFDHGEAMVCDFGVARAIVRASEETISSSGIVVGTPSYMSPEQAAGNGIVDRPSDIYGLACVAYEMLAGEPPFTGRTPQAVFARQIAQPPPSIRVVRPDVPEHVELALMRGLAKRPDDRPGTAMEFAMAMQAPDWEVLRGDARPRMRKRAPH
jgi:serine/threonine-protein kinase